MGISRGNREADLTDGLVIGKGEDAREIDPCYRDDKGAYGDNSDDSAI